MEKQKTKRLTWWAHGFALLASVSVGMAFFSPMGWDYAVVVAAMMILVWFVGAAVWESTRT